MASGSKRKTTMAKLNRERRLLERRQEKQARKAARKQAAADTEATQGVEGGPMTGGLSALEASDEPTPQA
jgi:hypothetical protein